MPLEETIYSASQINIPAELPDLLKQFTKAAIRTQPTDISDQTHTEPHATSHCT